MAVIEAGGTMRTRGMLQKKGHDGGSLSNGCVASEDVQAEALD